MFDLNQFVADCRTALAERSGAAVQEVMARVIADPTAITAALGEPSGPLSKVLFHAPDLTVLNLAWGPHQWTLPHNHNVRAVIGMYAGREDNMFWRRLPVDDTANGRRIEAAGAKSLCTRDVTILGQDIIHSVTNPLGKLSCALHVYDGDFFAAGRSHWDAETLEEQAFDVTQVSPMFREVPQPTA